MSLILPRRSFVIASSLAVLPLPACCRSDFRPTCEKYLTELDAVANRAPPALRPAVLTQRASLAAELAASAPGEPGMDARKALSGRLVVAIEDWDKKVDESLRLAALKPLSDAKWIGSFWRNGASHLGVKVSIKPDGSFANTRNVRHYSKVRLETTSGVVLRVRGAELTFKAGGPSNKEQTFVVDAPPHPLVGAQLGFVYAGDRYLLASGS